MSAFRPVLSVAVALAVVSVVLSQPAATSRQEVNICRVIDGDTVTICPLTPGGTERSVRLYGIDAPESDQPGGPEATRFVTIWIERHDLLLTVHDTDRYGRIIGELSIFGDAHSRTLNEELVYNGLAWWYREYAAGDEQLSALQAQAQAAKRGIWSQDSPVPPWEWR